MQKCASSSQDVAQCIDSELSQVYSGLRQRYRFRTEVLSRVLREDAVLQSLAKFLLSDVSVSYLDIKQFWQSFLQDLEEYPRAKVLIISPHVNDHSVEYFIEKLTEKKQDFTRFTVITRRDAAPKLLRQLEQRGVKTIRCGDVNIRLVAVGPVVYVGSLNVLGSISPRKIERGEEVGRDVMIRIENSVIASGILQAVCNRLREICGEEADRAVNCVNEVLSTVLTAW